MNVGVIGLGYVGLATALCLAEKGHQLYCCDTDAHKISLLQQRKLGIFEPGLDDLFSKHAGRGVLHFSTQISDVLKMCDMVFVAVGTPSDSQGRMDTSYLEKVVNELGNHVSGALTVVIKSTVPVGTCARLQKHFDDKTPRVSVVSNPEFLMEGNMVKTACFPERIVVGTLCAEDAGKMEAFYKNWDAPVLLTDCNSAELIKFAANAFLATKISYINALARLADTWQANIADVAKGMGLDTRIGSKFLNAGVGYGGSCFPKDVSSLIHAAADAGHDFALLKAVQDINNSQWLVYIDKLRSHLGGLAQRTIAVLGLSFKPQTDDVRAAPAARIIAQLLKEGARVQAYDPVVKLKPKGCEDIDLMSNETEALRGSDAAIIVTEWPQFATCDWESLASVMRQAVVVDGRNMLSRARMVQCGFVHITLGGDVLDRERLCAQH